MVADDTFMRCNRVVSVVADDTFKKCNRVVSVVADDAFMKCNRVESPLPDLHESMFLVARTLTCPSQSPSVP